MTQVIPDPFKYVPPAEEAKAHFEAVAEAIAEAYYAIRDHVPEGPDRTLAFRKLQEARMWANCAISFGGNSLP